MENGTSSRMPFQDNALKNARAGASKGGFLVDGDKMFCADRDGRYVRVGMEPHIPNRNWPAMRDARSPSGDGSDGEDENDDGEDDEDDIDEGDGLVSVDDGNHKNHNNSSGSVQSSFSEKNNSERSNSQEKNSSFGLGRGVARRDGNGMRGNVGEQERHQGRLGNYESAITVVESDPYYSQMLHVGGCSAMAQKMPGENGCGFGGRREIGLAIDPGESVRMHLSDPITGALMDDAMILSCGHSFGSGGMQDIYITKACLKCGHPFSEDSIRPNLALRVAVQAFRREEDSPSSKASKRKRDRSELEKSGHDDQCALDLSRGKGVQFPFSVSDRVVIKGNKRTPQRFVGRVAVVTTQCLNGWYVVKTLDNAESVKLQYRSLAKVTDDPSSKAITPNWL